MTQEIQLPEFYQYKNEDGWKVDSGFETIQDFNLSWILRCADDKYKRVNLQLHKYAKRIVFLLIHGINKDGNEYILNKVMRDEFKVTKVRIKRQFHRIDLVAEINTEEDSITEKYVLSIENKWYQPIKEGQLEGYKKVLEEEIDCRENKIINLCIFCDEKDENQKQRCRDNQYKFLTIGDIHIIAKMEEEGKTGNALFDEYWFNF